MSLTKSVVPVLFKGGLDQKTSEKLVMPGAFLALENCVRRKLGAIQKRFGFTSLSNRIFGSTSTIDEGKFLDVFEDDVILFGDEKLYSYSPANDAWIDKGSCSTAQVNLSALVRNNHTQAMADIAHNSGLTVVIYEDSSTGVRYSVYDDTTGAAIVYDTLIDASGSRPKVIAVPNGFVLAYIKAATILSRLISITTPSTLGSANTIVGSGVTSAPWDLDSYSNYGVFAYHNGTTVSVGYISAQALVGSPASNGLPAVTAILGTGTPVNALSIVGDSDNNKIWCIFHGSAGIVRALALSPDLATTAQSDVETIANTRNVTGVVRDADGYLRIYYEQSSSSVKDHYIKTAVVSWPGSGSITIQTAAAIFKRSVGLSSKAFEVSDRQYVGVSHDSALQPTYFTVRDDGFTVARVLGGSGGGHSRDSAGSLKSGLPRVNIDSDDRYATVVQVRNSLNIDSGGTILASNRGIEKAALDFEANLFGRTLGKNYHIVGGTVLNYDGVQVTEHGFYIFPEDVTSAVSAAGTALTTAAGAFSFRLIYEYTDGKGLIHRSAPSTTVSQALGTNGNKITVTAPTLRMTNKTATNVSIVLYLAVQGTTATYYRYSTTANDPTVNTVDIDITTAATASNEILYTTGGLLENICPPAAKCIHAHKQRLFLGGTEDGLVYFSKTQVPEEGIGFQDVVPVRVDAEGGGVAAFATLDDKVLLFKAGRIYFLSGEGPTDAGAQNDYFVPLRIASDLGSINPQSIAEIPQGIIFKSAKGFGLVTHKLGVEHIGDAVRDFDDLTVTSAIVLSKEREVRFTTSDGSCLVYNYKFDQWSTFNNYEAVAACSGLSTYLHLKSDGTVNQETPDAYSDNGARIRMAIETSWLAMASIQGLQRVYKALLLGDFVSHHYTKIQIAYDYEDAYNEIIFFNTQTGLVSSSVYGEGSTYGSASPYGGTGSSVYQCRLLPARQKCESMKLRIEDEDTIESTAGGSFVLVALTLEVGRMYGANKLGPLKSVGNG